MTAQTARNRRTAHATMMAVGSGWGCPTPTRRGRSWKIGQTHGLGARFPQLSSSIAGMVHASKAELPRLSAAHWPTGAYRREDLPERVLQFGTGMLLRALCATFVDAANTAGTFSGRSVVIQSTPHGKGGAVSPLPLRGTNWPVILSAAGAKDLLCERPRGPSTSAPKR